MDAILIIGGLGSLLLIAIIGLLLSIKLGRYRAQEKRIEQEHKAWERAQEHRQMWWEIKQDQRILELETKIVSQLEQLYRAWYVWESKNAKSLEIIAQPYEKQTQAPPQLNVVDTSTIEDSSQSLNGSSHHHNSEQPHPIPETPAVHISLLAKKSDNVPSLPSQVSNNDEHSPTKTDITEDTLSIMRIDEQATVTSKPKRARRRHTKMTAAP